MKSVGVSHSSFSGLLDLNTGTELTPITLHTFASARRSAHQIRITDPSVSNPRRLRGIISSETNECGDGDDLTMRMRGMLSAISASALFIFTGASSARVTTVLRKSVQVTIGLRLPLGSSITAI